MLRVQCFGSGSGWIRIIWPDPDPLQEEFIWIRVVKKNREADPKHWLRRWEGSSIPPCIYIPLPRFKTVQRI